MARFVWVGDDEPQTWLRGGTFLVARRIRMRIEVWDRSSLGDQQDTIGRDKARARPCGVEEDDPVDLDARQPDGDPVIPLDAHIRRAAGGQPRHRILRRGYSFTDGSTPRPASSTPACSSSRSSATLGGSSSRSSGGWPRADALNEYILHAGTAHFAVPPGARPRRIRIGQALFE